ncbi:MAG: hypothetical protein ACOXZZ_03650 [Sphaerochaetaceae bacterium]|jgi:YbbR domain-containing protein
MSSSSIWRNITNNWVVKVFSLLLAIAIYIIINYGVVDTREVEIPLNVIMPSEWVAISNVPESVTLIIKSDPQHSMFVDPADFEASADFSQVNQQGVSSAPVILNSDTNFKNMKLSFSTNPETIRIFFETKGSEGDQQ